MRFPRPSWAALLAVGLVALWLGCKGENGEPGPNGANGGQAPLPEDTDGAGDGRTPSSGGNGEEGATGQTPTGGPDEDNGTPDEVPPGESAAEAEMPEVRLPAMLKETCLVGVGDLMPDAPLDVLGGEEQQLSSQFGRRLTVMFFWKADDLYAQAELQDLTGDVVERFGDEGVRVIGINVGDSAEEAAAAVEAAEAGFPNFLDPQGEYFAKVATEKLPRTYLLNSEGRILWFDLEYSLTTQRQLEQAVEVALSKDPAAKPGDSPLVATRPEEPAPPEAETPEGSPPEDEAPDGQPPEAEMPEIVPPAPETPDEQPREPQTPDIVPPAPDTPDEPSPEVEQPAPPAAAGESNAAEPPAD